MGDEAEQRRAFVQHELKLCAWAAHDKTITGARRSLQISQAEYRRLAGGESDPSLCQGGRLRDKVLADGEAEARFATFSSDYRRKNGRRFDPRGCR